MRKLPYLFIAFFFFFIISCKVSNTKSTLDSKKVEYKVALSALDKIIDKRIIRIGTTGDYIPFSYQLVSDSHSYYGIDIAMAKDLANSLDVEVQFVKTS